MTLRFLTACFLALLLGAVPASAITRTVMQDGSGDFMDIQAAVDACAVGDTVLVGPGRYEGYHPFQPSGQDIGWEVIVGVAVDSLTIRGMDNETVILGPATKSDDRLVRIGIANARSTTWINLENLRFENIGSRGVDIIETGRVSECVFYHMNTGIYIEIGHDVLVEECQFQVSRISINYYREDIGAKVVIRNSHFESGGWGISGAGVYVERHPDTLVESCSFDNLTVAAESYYGAYLRVVSCEINGGNTAISGSNYGSGSIEVRDCRMLDQAIHTIRINGSHLTGTGNTLRCIGDYTIQAPNSSADFHGNHILKAGIGTIEVQYQTVPDQGLDFSGNWWGTTDADSIAAWIHDVQDDPGLVAEVVYEPYLPAPVAAEQKSMGDLKRMFR